MTDNKNKLLRIIAIIVGSIFLFAATAYATYMLMQQDQLPAESVDSDVQSFTNSSDASIPDSWKTYQSEEQGISFAYPDTYTELEADTTADSERESFQAQAPGYPQISLHVHDIDVFSAGSDVGGTWPRFYIAEEDRWVQRSGDQEKPVSVDEVGAVDGASVYLFETANISNRTRTYAVPVPDEGVMVELIFTFKTVEGSPDYTDREVDEQRILSSLKIADEGVVSDQDESSDLWRSYQNADHWFSFAYPEKWKLSTGESEGKDEVVARAANTEFSGESGTDVPPEHFLVREMSGGDCESGESSSLADQDTLDTGWVRDEFTGLPLRDICFVSQNRPLKITLSARNQSSENTLNRILNSFDLTALPDIPLTLKDIEGQYTDELLQSTAFIDKVGGDQSFVSREPIKFSVWDQIGTEDAPLAVINLLHTEIAEKPAGYEVILFDVDSNYNISNPDRIDEGSSAGSYSEDAAEYKITPYETPGQLAVNLEIRIPEIPNDSGEMRYIEKEFTRRDGEVDIISDNQDSEDFFLSGIKAQYTDELLSDPAFVSEGKMVKGGREFTVTSRTPQAYEYWDHDNDGEESLAVLNNASNIFELILFNVDEENQISNPQLIDNGGTATYVWDSADLQKISTDDGDFLRSSIRLGQSAPQTNDYTYVDGQFQQVSIVDGEVQQD